MENLIFLKELLTVIGSVTAILAALAALTLWIVKKAFQRGEGYQLFKNLVAKVSSIENLIDDKFIDNEQRHKGHDEKFSKHHDRISHLEVTTNVKDRRKETRG